MAEQFGGCYQCKSASTQTVASVPLQGLLKHFFNDKCCKENPLAIFKELLLFTLLFICTSHMRC